MPTSLSRRTMFACKVHGPSWHGYQTQPAPVGQVQDVFCSQGTADYLASFSNLARLSTVRCFGLQRRGLIQPRTGRSGRLPGHCLRGDGLAVCREDPRSLTQVCQSRPRCPGFRDRNQPDVETIPFTAPELLGTWSVADASDSRTWRSSVSLVVALIVMT